MCSIMGYTGKDLALDALLQGFEKTKSRGPDMSRQLDTPSGTLFFHRLAVMGLEESGMQPFTLGGDSVVCNGELTVNCCFRSTGSTALPCSECWMRNSR